MASFKSIREQILLSYHYNFISDEDFILLYDYYHSKNPEFDHEQYPPFQLDDIQAPECYAEFRVEKHHLPLLVDALQLPDRFVCEQRSVCSGIEGLCILLKRVAYPCRYSDMIPRFWRPVSVLSLITNQVIDYIFDHHAHRLTQWNHDILNPVSLQSYADAIVNAGAPLDNCFGFVDGTVRPLSRPGQQQRVTYNGHKRVHALKFQSVALPNGLIGNIYGPVEGRRHDSGMLVDSGLLNNLQQYALSPNGQAMCVYGDLGYPHRVQLQVPYRQAPLTAQMQNFNESMSAVRTSVEWLFGDIINSFKFLDLKKNLKLGLSSVGKMYIVCALLRNSLTCLYGNQTSEYFEMQPPSLQDYLQ